MTTHRCSMAARAAAAGAAARHGDDRHVLARPVSISLSDHHGTLAGPEQRRAVYLPIVIVLTLLELVTMIASIRRQLSLEQTNLRFNTALENMTHGICMFDGDKRLVICNDRYASLYRLPPELLKVGPRHEAIIAHRVMNGLLKGEKSAGAVDKKLGALGQHSSEKISSRIDELADGRPDPRHAAADEGRRLGGDARGHHRALSAREPARHDAGAGKPQSC